MLFGHVYNFCNVKQASFSGMVSAKRLKEQEHNIDMYSNDEYTSLISSPVKEIPNIYIFK